MLLKRRNENAGAKVDARKFQFVQDRCVMVRVYVRSTHELKRPRRSPSFGHLRPFQMNAARKHRGGIYGGHVWRWQYPGTIGFVIPQIAAPAAHRYAFQLAADSERVIEQARQLANRHSMPRGNRKLPHERTEGWIKHRALNLRPIDRIRPVADHDFLPQTLGGAHAIRHRIDKGVDARPDVL